jgi:hypothetical protein
LGAFLLNLYIPVVGEQNICERLLDMNLPGGQQNNCERSRICLYQMVSKIFVSVSSEYEHTIWSAKHLRAFLLNMNIPEGQQNNCERSRK